MHCETMEVGMRGEAISVVDKSIFCSSSVTRIQFILSKLLQGLQT